MTDTLGLYLHIPYCRARCRYCGFYSISAMPGDRFIEAMLREMEQYSQAFGEKACDTVYFGGGTPSALSAAQLGALMEGVRRYFHVTDTAEITMEMNPCDMTDAYLAAARQMGINRLSVGVQARQDHLLRAIGRLHSAAEAASAIRRAFRAGFHNISMDLMYELPGQSAADFEASLLWAMHLPITHMSIYSLILEEGTPFARLAEKGRLPRPTEAESWAMYQAMCRVPGHYGFSRYEISSFARPGFASRHNEKYWRLDPYLGMGPAACSRIGRERWKNVPGTKQYIQELMAGRSAPIEKEALTEAEEMEEYCFLHLRMASGIPLADFERRYGHPLTARYAEPVKRLLAEKLLVLEEGSLRLTRRGMAVGNLVFEEFLLG